MLQRTGLLVDHAVSHKQTRAVAAIPDAANGPFVPGGPEGDYASAKVAADSRAYSIAVLNDEQLCRLLQHAIELITVSTHHCKSQRSPLGRTLEYEAGRSTTGPKNYAVGHQIISLSAPVCSDVRLADEFGHQTLNLAFSQL